MNALLHDDMNGYMIVWTFQVYFGPEDAFFWVGIWTKAKDDFFKIEYERYANLTVCKQANIRECVMDDKHINTHECIHNYI